MRLILIGPMASGKSTVGRKLSKRLNLDFIDVDEEVENLRLKSYQKLIKKTKLLLILLKKQYQKFNL